MPEPLKLKLADAQATDTCGRALARALPLGSLCIWLTGELGAGKTTLVRGLLRGLGHRARVPSPTYTLVEPYALKRGEVIHTDLYRLQSPSEAGALALDEYLDAGAMLLIEWPERGAQQIPAADLRIHLNVTADGRSVELSGDTALGWRLLTDHFKFPL